VKLKSGNQEAELGKKLNFTYILLILAFVIVLIFLYRSYDFRLELCFQKQLFLDRAKSKEVLEVQLE
jgi:hypothetical protein